MLSNGLKAVILVLFAGVLVMAWVLDTAAQHDHLRGRLFQDSGDPQGLMVHALADKNTLDSNESLYVDWTFENRSSREINVAIDFNAPGFDNLVLPEKSFTLTAGNSKTIPLILHPSEGGQFRLTGRYKSSFSKSSDALDLKTAGEIIGESVLGPVDVETPWRRFIRVSRQLYSVLKDLALPILLACLAYVFQKRQKDRDDKLARDAAKRDQDARALDKARDEEIHKREKARDEKSAKDREDREYRVQVRNIQLPRFQEYAETHYLPILRSLRLLRNEFDRTWKTGGPSHAQLELLLYRLAMFLKRMQLLRDQRGGIFFQVRRAETILQGAWFCFNHHVEDKLGMTERDAILALARANEDFVEFQARSGHASVKQVLKKLSVWVSLGNDPSKGGLMNCLDLAAIMQSVLSFETNRPLDEYWYEESEGLDLKAFEDYQIPVEPYPQYTTLKREIPLYRQDVGAYLSERGRRPETQRREGKTN